MHFCSRIYQYENAFIDDLAKLVSIPSVCTTATGAIRLENSRPRH